MVYHVPLAFQCIYGHCDEGGEMVMGRRRVRFLRAIVGRFVEVYRRSLNAVKSKVMVLNGDEALEC